MATKSVNPKGQVVIPKQMRDAARLKPNAEATPELRNDKIIIKKPKNKGSYTEYYTSTTTPKQKKPVNIKQITTSEDNQRHSLR